MNDIGATIITIVLAAGIPSAIFSTFIKRLERKIDETKDEQKKNEARKLEHELMVIDMTIACLDLSEVTAEAVQRIPDAKCNGEMTAALQSAKAIQTKYRDFVKLQAVQSLEKGAKA